MINKELLEKAGREKNLVNKEYIEKDYFQDLLLYHLFKKTNKLVFKGGTCLYKLYSLQRFSEDLDFSIIKKLNLKQVLREIEKEIKGMEIKDIKEMKNTILIKLKFKGILTKTNTIRLDINTGNPILTKYDVKTYTPSYVDLMPFNLRVLSIEEILSEKIHSLLARDKARDLYDLFFLLKFVKPDKNLIKKKLNNFGMKLDYNEIKKKIKGMENLWEPELKHFVIKDIPEFKPVKEYVLKRLGF